MTPPANRALARVLKGEQNYWTNGKATVRHNRGTWSWTTPDGKGSSTKWENALAAVADYLGRDR